MTGARPGVSGTTVQRCLEKSDFVVGKGGPKLRGGGRILNSTLLRVHLGMVVDGV